MTRVGGGERERKRETEGERRELARREWVGLAATAIEKTAGFEV